VDENGQRVELSDREIDEIIHSIQNSFVDYYDKHITKIKAQDAKKDEKQLDGKLLTEATKTETNRTQSKNLEVRLNEPVSKEACAKIDRKAVFLLEKFFEFLDQLEEKAKKRNEEKEEEQKEYLKDEIKQSDIKQEYKKKDEIDQDKRVHHKIISQLSHRRLKKYNGINLNKKDRALGFKATFINIRTT
jgi:hypothetical protein